MALGTSERLRQAAEAFASNWRNPNLRRAQLAFLGAWTAEWAFTVALGIVAYADGGALALGLVGLLRMLPSAILAPLLSPYADRGRRERVLVVVSTLRGLATAVAAVMVAVSGPIVVGATRSPWSRPSPRPSSGRRTRLSCRRSAEPGTNWPARTSCAGFSTRWRR